MKALHSLLLAKRFRVTVFLTTVLMAAGLGSAVRAQNQAIVEARITKPNPKPVALDAGVATLTPKNTSIHFVGEHEGPKPDPRKGGFAKFAGKLELSSDGALQTVGFDIETKSLFTEMPKLTGHLLSPDFFDVREHPQASFRSTSVAPSKQADEIMVTGDFTLLGTTKTIAIPAKLVESSEGVTLVSKFALDRTRFGMNYGVGKVKKKITIQVVVGEPTNANPK